MEPGVEERLRGAAVMDALVGALAGAVVGTVTGTMGIMGRVGGSISPGVTLGVQAERRHTPEPNRESHMYPSLEL